MITGGRPGRIRAILVALAVLPLLSGCIAAAALPVLAAGGVVKSRTDDRRSSQRAARVAIPADPAHAAVASATPTASQPSPVAREYTLGDGTQVMVTNSLRAPVADVPAPAASAPARAPATLPADGPGYRVTTLTELPAPGAAPARSEPAVAGSSSYSAFTAYAATRAAVPVIGSERHSALLADAASMTAQTRVCSIQPASVLIDLDPGSGNFDLKAEKPTDPALADRLAALRENGVVVGWVSNRTADQAGMVRRALKLSGLDQDGRDELVLLRFPEERKQTRREDFAKSHCVLAIAGDERADFDELFAYLREPAAALPLDKLIGAGWFIVPPPLATN